jgi:hypothetical protein
MEVLPQHRQRAVQRVHLRLPRLQCVRACSRPSRQSSHHTLPDTVALPSSTAVGERVSTPGRLFIQTTWSHSGVV